MKNNKIYMSHIPSKGVVDDRNTSESQMIGIHKHPQHSKYMGLQVKKYLSGTPTPLKNSKN